MKPIPHFSRAAAAAAAILTAGCKIPPVRLETPEPVKVDVNVKVELYSKDFLKSAASEDDFGVGHSRRLRAEQIQNLKNSGLVGETKNGYLEARGQPAGEWAGLESYIKELIADENSDRQVIFASSARRENKSLEDVERQGAERLRAASHPGEWYQAPDGQWLQKPGTVSPPAEPTTVPLSTPPDASP